MPAANGSEGACRGRVFSATQSPDPARGGGEPRKSERSGALRGSVWPGEAREEG